MAHIIYLVLHFTFSFFNRGLRRRDASVGIRAVLARGTVYRYQ